MGEDLARTIQVGGSHGDRGGQLKRQPGEGFFDNRQWDWGGGGEVEAAGQVAVIRDRTPVKG